MVIATLRTESPLMDLPRKERSDSASRVGNRRLQRESLASSFASKIRALNSPSL